MLNKDLCLRALNKIWHAPINNEFSDSDYVGESFSNEFKILKEIIEEHFSNPPLIKCEKCGKEMEHIMINKFNIDGSDSFNEVPYVIHRDDCISVITDGNWTGYELSEEEMLETIVCPHCGNYPFEEKEIYAYDEVEIVMFPKARKEVQE